MSQQLLSGSVSNISSGDGPGHGGGGSSPKAPELFFEDMLSEDIEEYE